MEQQHQWQQAHMQQMVSWVTWVLECNRT